MADVLAAPQQAKIDESLRTLAAAELEAARSSLDHTVRIWDAHTLRVLRVLDHPDPVYLVAFSPDSREVVTEDAAHLVRVWDACTACGDRTALLALARSRVTRVLTAQERRTFQGQ